MEKALGYLKSSATQVVKTSPPAIHRYTRPMALVMERLIASWEGVVVLARA